MNIHFIPLAISSWHMCAAWMFVMMLALAVPNWAIIRWKKTWLISAPLANLVWLWYMGEVHWSSLYVDIFRLAKWAAVAFFIGLTIGGIFRFIDRRTEIARVHKRWEAIRAKSPGQLDFFEKLDV